jgi:hypothetical protein
MWKIDYDAFDIQTKLGGQDYEPFLNMLEGGMIGDLYKEMEDLFYFSQLQT